jgi:hypothetical protein
MKDEEIIKELEIIEKWLHEVSENNDHEVRKTSSLKSLLFTLKIVGKDLPAIKPICQELQNIINELHDSTNILVHEGRTELRQAFEVVKKYIIGKENIK